MLIQEEGKYKQVIIWYFSGTGNARFAAEQIQTNVLARGIPAKVYNIANYDKEMLSVSKGTLLGFCYPTHGFNAPPIVLKFINKFPANNADVFLLNTRAGLKISKLHLPGISGLALWLPALMLFFKGFKPIGFRPLDMPSNWISLHPGLRNKVVLSIKADCTITLSFFTERIINGKLVLNGLLWLPLDLLLTPVSFLYYFYGRFALAKTFYANYNCNNCGICIARCPVQAIIERHNSPYWTFKCESCMKCVNECPQRAIEIAHSYLFLLWWLGFSLIPVFLTKLLYTFGFISEAFYHRYFGLLFYGSSFVFGLIIVFLGYRILHQLLRIKSINKIITKTSLTHYKIWRRYRLDKRHNHKSF
jgi:Pyruvate/2-oxoacid:ferredoxin oxidoreductase delta subunit